MDLLRWGIQKPTLRPLHVGALKSARSRNNSSLGWGNHSQGSGLVVSEQRAGAPGSLL